jgi:hypothetical protein
VLLRLSRAATAALLLVLSASALEAQVPLTARALGMGGAYIGAARGYEALFLNPANLALPDNPRWSVSFPQVTAAGTLLGPSFEDLPDLYTAIDDGTADATAAFLAKVPASGTEAQFDVRAPLATLQIGRVALGVNYGSIGQHTFGKDIIELFVDGYEEGRADYAVGNTAGSRVTYWDVALGYGQRVGPLSLGVTGHYLRAGTAMQSRMYEPRVDLENQDIEVNYVAVLARGGTGYAVDFGAALQPVRTVTLSGSVSSAFSKLDWSEDLLVRDFVLDRSTIDTMSMLNLAKAYSASEEALDPTSSSLRALETAEGLYDQAYFPATAHAGINWKPFGWTNLGASYREQLTTGRLSGRWDREVSVGVQQRLPLVVLRAGYATNLEQGTMISGGLTLGPIQLGAAHLDDGMYDGAPRSGWIGTFGLGVMAPR